MRFSGDKVSHSIVFDASSDETATEALAWRNVPAPVVPSSAKLLFSVQYKSPKNRTLMSLVGAMPPLLSAADVASCDVVERPLVNIDMNTQQEVMSSEPRLLLRWQPTAIERLRTFLGTITPKDPAMTVWIALGDEALDYAYVSSEKPSETKDTMNLAIPAADPDAARARGIRICVAIDAEREGHPAK
jgi:hypothetical protein